VTLNSRTALTSAIVLAALSFGCGDLARQGRSPSQLVIQTLVGIPGDSPSSRGTTFISDVLTQVTQPDPCTSDTPCPTWINDQGEVTMSVMLKDAGQPTSAPSAINAVTLTRYHVEFARSDGRNQPGVDVPYPFDSAFTVTVPADGTAASAAFDLVRNNAKKEPPLISMVCSSARVVEPPSIDGSPNCPPLISTIATVTFYGHDQAGTDVSATGSIGVTFGDITRGQ
jgi:hypothetical protein